MASNVQWAESVAKTVSTNAKQAMRDQAHPDRLATLHEVWDATMKEVKGMWMGPGLTLEELLDQYGMKGSGAGRHAGGGPARRSR